MDLKHFRNFVGGFVLLLVLQLAKSDSPCNDYVDKVLRDLKNDKEYFEDPYKIPEKVLEVNKKVLFVNYTAEAKIHDGYIFGLSSLNREGDVIVDKKKKTHLKIYLGAGVLKMECSGKVKLMGHGPAVTVEGEITYVSMKLDIVPNEKGQNPKVANFNIEEVKGAEFHVTGLGPLNFLMNAYIKVLGVFFKGLVKLGVEGRLKAFMSDKLSKYEIPEECLNSVYFGNQNF